MSTTPSENNYLSGILGIALLAALFYAIWQVNPMVQYLNGINFGQHSNSEQDFMMAYIVFSLEWSGVLLWLSTLGFISVLLIGGDKSPVGLMMLFLIPLALLGWYVGSEYKEAVIEKIVCEKNGGIFSLCLLDAPLFSYMFFNMILLLFVVVVLAALVFLAGSKIGENK